MSSPLVETAPSAFSSVALALTNRGNPNAMSELAIPISATRSINSSIYAREHDGGERCSI